MEQIGANRAESRRGNKQLDFFNSLSLSSLLFQFTFSYLPEQQQHIRSSDKMYVCVGLPAPAGREDVSERAREKGLARYPS